MVTNRADFAIDRIELKRKLSQWRTLAVLALVFSAIIFIESHLNVGGKGSSLASPYIGRVTVLDFVHDDPEFIDMLDEVKDNDKIKAVIVTIDTPGGSAVGGEEIYRKLREIAGKKPVVAVMRSMATSAGYMIAIASDHVIARQGTITGSIGVLIETAEVTELAAKLGITPITIKSTPLKGSPGLLEKASPEAIASLQVLIDDFYQTFVGMVAERRKLTTQKAYELADGRVYSGNMALKNGLIDELGGEEQALNWLSVNKKINKNLEVRDVEPESKNKDILQKLTETVSRKFLGSSTSSLDGLLAIWHPSL